MLKERKQRKRKVEKTKIMKTQNNWPHPMAFDNGGMTLKAYYAGQALTGMLARDNGYDPSDEVHRQELASTVWSIAEAMIEDQYATPRYKHE
tara:strand:+ start:618 stop:893 length:276 start_codon:yes stop_codon:yes gene_type:complete